MANLDHKLDILVKQIEQTYNKTIIYKICEVCNDPIVISDLPYNYGEQCSKCNKWFCTKRYSYYHNYFESCAFKNIFGCFLSDCDDIDNLSLLCLPCVTSHITNKDTHIICEHLQKSMKENKLHCNTIIIKNKGFYCEECDAIDNIEIHL